MEFEIKNKVFEFDDFIKSSLENVSKVMKNANNLPVADYEYWSIDKCFMKAVDVQSSRMINMIQYILTNHGFKNGLSEVRGVDDEDSLACVTSICDQLMERINTNLDKASGKRHSSSLLLVSKQDSPKTMKMPNISSNKISLITQKCIPKPQASFKDKVDNSDQLFKPRLTSKPHAIKSLEESLTLENGQFAHPYAVELEMLQVHSQLLQTVEPKPPLSLEQTPFSYIDTQHHLKVLVDKLLQVSEVAIDLEHHSFRSYQGFTCLMQLSTRHEDFIVDTIALRHHMQLLNPVFTHPNIVKVFHGSDSDVEWLQKDFGLYLVNCFDTGQASRLLQLPHFSLAYLLQEICNVTADKQFQKADWRIRKLPEIYLKYAREDTHYLLYIYDVLRNRLLEHGANEAGKGEKEGCEQSSVEENKRSLILQAFANSKEICKKKYTKNVVEANSHLVLYERKMGRGGVKLSDRSLEVLRRLYAWRDKLARVEDESTGYILPSVIMLKIAQTMPVSESSILQCCITYIPPTLKRELEAVKMIVNDVINLPAPLCQHTQDETVEQAWDVDAVKVNADPATRDMPSYAQATFDQIDYDESSLNPKSKIDTCLESTFSQLPGELSCEHSVLSKLDKIFMPYMPQEMFPKEYKKGNFKVKFIASRPVEIPKTSPIVKPEEVVTNAEMNFSNTDVALRNKIKAGKKNKWLPKVLPEVQESDDVTSSSKHIAALTIDTTTAKGSINSITTSAKASTTKKDKKSNNVFVPKVYKKEELQGMIKVEQSKKTEKKRAVYDVNEDLAKHPAASKKRKNFHKSNKSHSFMPNK